MNDSEAAWVPQACTLPTQERPLRVAEFDELFATSLRNVHRPARQRLQLILDPAAEQRVRELTALETECCSFFAFSISANGDQVCVEVDVPEGHVDVLDALMRSATAGQDRATESPRI
jgi:hypothetical protein